MLMKSTGVWYRALCTHDLSHRDDNDGLEICEKALLALRPGEDLHLSQIQGCALPIFFPFFAGVCSGGGSLEMLTPHAAPRQVATNSALKQRNESDRLMWIGFGTPSARLRLPPHARPGGKV